MRRGGGVGWGGGGGGGERERGREREGIYFTLLYFTSRVGTSRAVAGDYMDPIHTCRVLTMVPNVRGTLYT